MATKSAAQGNLLITPKRVVFEGPVRFKEMNLANTGQDTARYQISFLQIRMKDDGSFETITEPDPGQNFSDKYLRVFPRTITLAPNEAQVVKVQLTRTNNLSPGEYRSHLHFRSIDNARPLGESDIISETRSGLSVRLTPVFGITVPVILRVGENDADVSISNLSVTDKDSLKPFLNLSLNRTGKMSFYGDLIVNYISTSGKETRIGIIKGISVYTPNKLRNIKINLIRNEDVNFHEGKLQVQYSSGMGQKLERFAQAELALQ